MMFCGEESARRGGFVVAVHASRFAFNYVPDIRDLINRRSPKRGRGPRRSHSLDYDRKQAYRERHADRVRSSDRKRVADRRAAEKSARADAELIAHLEREAA